YVRLTCKEKRDREHKGTEHPSGVVSWYVEVFDQEDELVAIATILTMVQKRQETFVEMTDAKIEECLTKLKEDAKPKWGIMTPQHMIEHLEFTYKIDSGDIQDFEVATPEKILDKVHASLYDFKKLPHNYNFPLLEENKLEELQHPDLDTAKKKLLEARAKYITYFK